MQTAARFGFARMFGRYAVNATAHTVSLTAAELAVGLAPSDAEAYRARARVLNRLGRQAEAAKSFETATSLRSRDDYLWLELGSTRDELGDSAGALAAYDQAVRWAPYYGHTHWQRGNLRLRMGQYEGAFEDLRAAVASKKSLLPNFIDLAWGLSRGEVNTVEQLVPVKDDRDRLALARFLAQKGKGKECLRHVSLLAAPLSEENRSQIVSQLLGAKAFREAFELWRTDPKLNMPVVLNGGFEEPLLLTNRNFGWIVVGKPEPRIVLDADVKLGGSRSLLVGYNGDWREPSGLISQLIVVEPQKRYRISFGVKTKELVTGRPPLIVVSDAGGNQQLGNSEVFPTPSSDWQTMSFEFSTTPTTQAIVLELKRVDGACNPCPIFGTMWLDNFLIEDVGSINSQR